MINLKKLIFGGRSAPADLAPEVGEALAAWRARPAPAADEAHFHSRYVVVDLVLAGEAEQSLQGIAAAGLTRGGVIMPDDVMVVGATNDGAAFDRQLAALLCFAAKAPLVSYRVPFVDGVLRQVYGERLGVDFRPTWIDLAWLLPELFQDVSATPVAREVWLGAFHVEAPAERDALTRVLSLAKLMQVALARAGERGIDTPARLAEAAQARRFLRQNA